MADYKIASDLNLYGNKIKRAQEVIGKDNFIITGEGTTTIKGSAKNKDLIVSSQNENTKTTIKDESMISASPIITQISANYTAKASETEGSSQISVTKNKVSLGKGETTDVNNRLDVDADGISINTDHTASLIAGSVDFKSGEKLAITSDSNGSNVKAEGLQATDHLEVGGFFIKWDPNTETLVFTGRK